jgi:hypothetical protein
VPKDLPQLEIRNLLGAMLEGPAIIQIIQKEVDDWQRNQG